MKERNIARTNEEQRERDRKAAFLRRAREYERGRRTLREWWQQIAAIHAIDATFKTWR